MDNKKILWAIVIVVVLGGAWYAFSYSPEGNGAAAPVVTTPLPTSATKKTTTTTHTSTGGTTTKKPATTTSVPATVKGVNTIAYLFSLKQTLSCAVTTTTGYKRSGTMYIGDGQMRADFTSSSMIADGTYLYAWTTGAPTGLKLSASPSVSGSVIASNGGFDPANSISFACNPWTKDASVFTPPNSVLFSNSL